MGEETKVKAKLICDQYAIYGEESIVDITKLNAWEVENKVSTQNILLDIMLGGGIPRGVVECSRRRFRETTLCLHLARGAKKWDGLLY